jgi:hypothetical protein
MATPITETQEAFNALSTFFSNVATYLLTGGVPPEPENLTGSLEFPELLTFSTSQAERASGFEVGSSQESIATCWSVTREFGMASQRKGSIYNSMSGEATDEATFYDQFGSFLNGVMSGSPSNGSQC